jgi:HAD superfamily hydrolase (TIGR01509 family)
MNHPAAIIFDLDGTLTRPVLDFDAIAAEIGAVERPLLEGVSRLSGEARRRAEAILHRHESAAAAQSELQPDAAAVVRGLRAAGILVALMTRNSRESAATFVKRHGLEFDFVRTREDGPIKPDPEPVRAICAGLGASPRRTWVVGDYLFDLRAGRAAGATTVLLLNDPQPPEWAGEADHVIRGLAELPGLFVRAAGSSSAETAGDARGEGHGRPACARTGETPAPQESDGDAAARTARPRR